MTKKYWQMPVADALYTAARKYPKGLKALAERMDKSENVLRSKLAPDVDTHHITLEETLQIIELLDCSVPHAADQVIKSIGWRLGRIVTRHSGTDSDDSSLERQGLTVAAVTGILAANLVYAIASKTDGQPLTKQDADTIQSDIARALDALSLLADSVERRTGDK